MNGGIIALGLGGIICFCVGAYLAATGERPMGIVFMASGLIFQVLCLRQLKMVRQAELQEKGSDDAGR